MSKPNGFRVWSPEYNQYVHSLLVVTEFGNLVDVLKGPDFRKVPEYEYEMSTNWVDKNNKIIYESDLLKSDNCTDEIVVCRDEELGGFVLTNTKTGEVVTVCKQTTNGVTTLADCVVSGTIHQQQKEE